MTSYRRLLEYIPPLYSPSRRSYSSEVNFNYAQDLCSGPLCLSDLLRVLQIGSEMINRGEASERPDSVLYISSVKIVINDCTDHVIIYIHAAWHPLVPAPLVVGQRWICDLNPLSKVVRRLVVGDRMPICRN